MNDELQLLSLPAIRHWEIARLLPPGAAHMSRTLSFGLRSKAIIGNIEAASRR